MHLNISYYKYHNEDQLILRGKNELECLNKQDAEWANDWKVIVEIFDTIDHFESLLKKLDMPFLREIHQKVLTLNLKKYAWSLQNYIIEKYSNEYI